MTDEQLDELEAVVRETGHMTKLEAITVLADYRRLRELERACRAIWMVEPGVTIAMRVHYPGDTARYYVPPDQVDAIGRLLEAEGE